MSEERDILNLTDDEEEYDDEQTIPELHGTLNKWTNYLHGWQDRYIVLKDGTLSYYKSETETAFGCRGAVSLTRASVIPHQFDECRFDVSVNDSVWYLRAESVDERQQWIDAVELHRQAESGYGSENNLRRHGSMLSLTSGTSLSTTSTSSFKRGRGLKEKLMEMETFRDILCRQIDTLQSYFDSCASVVSHGALHELPEADDIDDDVDIDRLSSEPSVEVHGHHDKFEDFKGQDLVSVLQQHGGHAVDFKGEAFTFKATTAGIVATLSHCIDLMSQREESWRKRLEREIDRRKKLEDLLKHSERPKPIVVGGPDYEEGPHCMITEDEFYDAVDATLDKMEREEEKKKKEPIIQPPKISLPSSHHYYAEINKVVSDHLFRLNERTKDGQDTWQLIAEDGDLKVFKREVEENGIVIDPLKATHFVKGITGHELCHYFWDIEFRMEWEATLETCKMVEWLSEDTLISNNIIKRVWPASQRDALFWSHIRHINAEHEDEHDSWIVVNYSTDHPNCPAGKYVRITMNVALVGQTIIEPPADGNITRDNISCKVSYQADVNPGGWAPASVLRAVYKREYPKFIKRFTQYVKDKTADKDILF
ncbi:ceramide transfer protein-like [Gigantopelta aegis]|uniref:ceramide transfer protein-like n=1 Tax=Gigantopelta aegis TaxID=1735272 RepID=UPI001B8875E4|nr:ceramide transfer protein-like [Gigantopelta aegis]